MCSFVLLFLLNLATHAYMMHFADGSLENGIVRPQMYQPVSALQVEFILTLSAMLLKKQLI